MLKFLQLRFLPKSTDLGLLALRLWLGLSMAILHGWGKLLRLSEDAPKFADPFGIGVRASLGLTVFAELVCAVLIAVGLFTRFAAFACAFTMAVAFYVGHQARLTGDKNGELAFIYLAGFVALLLAGGGRYSADAKLGG